MSEGLSQSLRIIFDIEDENITFEEDCLYPGTMNDEDCLIIEAHLKYIPSHCERCGTENKHNIIIKNGTKTDTVHVPWNSLVKRYLILHRQIYFCKHCKKTFITKSPVTKKGYYTYE